MGIYFNPGNESYAEAVNSQIYIDKTEMILFLNSVLKTKQKYICVSRPRRFGKTMAADMICAYYDREADGRELFEKRKLAGCMRATDGNYKLSWDAYLSRFDVIRVVMTRFFKRNLSVDEALSNLQKLVVREIKKAYPDIDYYDENSLLQSLDDLYSSTKRQVVIVIDEWDAVFRIRQNDKDGQTQYLDFLRELLKDNDSIALAYMTGILPIKKNGEHSALNMFTEFSMITPGQLAPYTGFTEDEVKGLCAEYHMDYGQISDWYEGYVISDQIPPDERKLIRNGEYQGHRISIYNPLSVVESMTTGRIQNYWNRTETYEALAEYIRRDYDGLKDAVALLMNNVRIKVDTSSYQNDMTTFHGRDDVLSLLIHLGYLGFDDETSEVFIPNKEILDEFKTSTKSVDQYIPFF